VRDHDSGGQRELPRLMLISDVGRVGQDRFLRVLDESWSAGLRMLQVREPGSSAEDMRALIEVILLGAPDDAIVLVNRRIDVAIEFRLGGVHIGGGDPSKVREARALLSQGSLVGYSAHQRGEIDRAHLEGGDYVTYSPIFGALSKRHPLPPVGAEGLREVCEEAKTPVFALGGVTPRHVHSVRAAGAHGVAVIGAILDADDPRGCVREFLSEWAASEME